MAKIGGEPIYTAIDGYCGAGGISEGMDKANLDVIAAFDHSPEAVATYQLDMQRTTKASCQEVSEWVKEASRRRDRPAILHLSCPCQPFSVSHTTIGKNDTANRDCSLLVGSVVDVLRPRLLTLEQSFRIVDDQHRLWFPALISQLMKAKYSFRMKIDASDEEQKKTTKEFKKKHIGGMITGKSGLRRVQNADQSGAGTDTDDGISSGLRHLSSEP